jgi:hypothetical protein
LVEQGLKDMVIRAVDQDDLGIAQEARRRHTSKPAPNNDNAFSSHGMREQDRLNQNTISQE